MNGCPFVIRGHINSIYLLQFDFLYLFCIRYVLFLSCLSIIIGIEDAICVCYTSIGRKFPHKHGHAENRAGISADSHNLRLKWPGTMEIFAVIDFSRPMARVQMRACT